MNIIEKILDKEELKNVPKELVEEKLERLFDKKSKEKYEKLGTKFFRSKEYKELQKKVRSELREVYGVFFEKDNKKREKFLKNLIKEPSIDNHMKVLELHKSSKERLPFYEEIYSKIFSITGKTETILDLACGYNPVSYPFMKHNVSFIAIDMSKQDMEFLEEYFNSSEIKGVGIPLDLTKEESLEKISHMKADVCFLFKALDSIETRKRNFSKELIDKISAKWLVISFPTKSLGGNKEIKTTKRKWIEKNYKINETFEIPNEIFYIIKNNNI
jgi:16S rRNA (guanine(1405)-N(7))-methyltransferase